MEDFPKVKTENNKTVISARELYTFLGATERFSNWFERQIQYGFVENQDYIGCKVFNTLANQELWDYAITIDCAKEISMLQKSENGKKARQYFIECEKQLSKPKELSRKEMALMVIAQEEEIERLALENKELSAKEAYHAPMVEAYHILQDSGKAFSLEEAAKALGFKSRTVFVDKLKKFDRLTKNNLPTSIMAEKGYMTTKIVTIMKFGKPEPYTQTFITPSGLEYLANRLGLVKSSTESMVVHGSAI